MLWQVVLWLQSYNLRVSLGGQCGLLDSEGSEEALVLMEDTCARDQRQ